MAVWVHYLLNYFGPVEWFWIASSTDIQSRKIRRVDTNHYSNGKRDCRKIRMSCCLDRAFKRSSQFQPVSCKRSKFAISCTFWLHWNNFLINFFIISRLYTWTAKDLKAGSFGSFVYWKWVLTNFGLLPICIRLNEKPSFQSFFQLYNPTKGNNSILGG